jgi:enoyl-CoA hydratase/carnithine racemase
VGTIEYREEGPVAIVTLNRPDSLNSITTELLDELRDATRRISTREDLRAVVIAGNDAAFCAGADLKDQAPRVADLTPSQMWGALQDTVATFRAVASIPQPTIAAMSGVALGGGLELALCCDLRVAAPGTRLGLPEAKVGMMPAAGGTQRLPRLIGASRAAELMLTSSMIDAARAYEIGLVNVVDEDWLGAACKLGERIARSSPVAVRLIKNVMWQGLDASLEAGIGMEAVAVGVVFSTEDRREGLAAFLEKRPPQWQGR